jgi:hypothetical protein
LTNPNAKYPVTLEVMVGVIDDNYTFFNDDVNQRGLSFTGLELLDIHTHVIGESIVINDKSATPKPLIYFRIANISSIERDMSILIIDDLSKGTIFLKFKTETDAIQAFSLFNYVLENPNVIKSSVLGTSGMMSTKYRWARRPQPSSVVKPDDHKNLNSQSDYISILKRKTLSNITSCNNTDGTKPVAPGIQCCPLLKTNNFNVPTIHITKQMSDYTPISQSEYLLELDKKCTGNDYNQINNGISKTPIPVCGHK